MQPSYNHLKSRWSNRVCEDHRGFTIVSRIDAIDIKSHWSRIELVPGLASQKFALLPNPQLTTPFARSDMLIKRIRTRAAWVGRFPAVVRTLMSPDAQDDGIPFQNPVAYQKAMSEGDALTSSLSAFGLQDQAHKIVGTPIRKGVSGGQKRRLSIASQLITTQKILFLDEPTSGLDSKANYEVINYLRSIVRKQRFLLDLTSSDFSQDRADAQRRLEKLHSAWRESSDANAISADIAGPTSEKDVLIENKSRASFLKVTLALLHRSFIKSYRDVVAYGIRFAMYIGLAIKMGTVWLRHPPTQSSIGPFASAIFFGSAFMSFMAVAYVPAFLEDPATFIKERANGLYGAAPFMIPNLLIGLPFLFLISLVFSLIIYFLNNFRPTAGAFFTRVMWLFLDLLAGVFGCPYVLHLPNIRHRPSSHRIRKQFVDECWRFFGLSRNAKSILGNTSSIILTM
ncbi:MAG: hypothetical protein Q9161_006196 [Pseudevernia consocians]